MSVAIYAFMLQLQDIARGQLFNKVIDKANMGVQTAQPATQSRTMQPRQATTLQPRQGPEANNEGRPRSTGLIGT
jgi:hypothetical protein